MFSKKIYTSSEISFRMYLTIDSDRSGNIDFEEFMKYIILLLEGSQEEKSQFIFNFISIRKKSKFFELEDLIEFYCLISKNETPIESVTRAKNQKEEEMAKIVFDLMETDYRDKVVLSEFQLFLKKDKEYQNLFNFLSVDAKINRDNLRVKKNYKDLIRTIKLLVGDIVYLEGLIFPRK